MIKKYNLDCDLRKQDSLYLSFKKSHEKWLKEEANIREKENLPFELIDERNLKKIHPVKNYTLGLKYPGSYGINPFSYCQEMKNLLLEKGVKIYEDSEVHKIEGNTARTRLGSIIAKNILICIDKMKAEFNEEISKKIYHIQSYLAVSEPLSKNEIEALYPKEELMCWDTRIIYMHYRPVAGNRIIIGGSGLWTTYSSENFSSKIIEKFINELKKRVSLLENVKFSYYWAGLADVTQDLQPIVDYDKNNKSIQYALGCAGLPWAAYCGDYIARRIIGKKVEDLSEFTKLGRKFFVPKYLKNILGKRITFALSHLNEYFQT